MKRSEALTWWVLREIHDAGSQYFAPLVFMVEQITRQRPNAIPRRREARRRNTASARGQASDLSKLERLKHALDAIEVQGGLQRV